MSNEYDVIVVGAGVMGLSCAYRLAKQGKKVCVLEQSTNAINLNGGSHGESRIIRLAHSDSTFVPIAIESYRMWRTLEHETGSKLYENNGLLWLGDEQGSRERAAILARYDAPHELLNNQQINNRYKHLNYDSKWFAILDHTAGTIFARKCIEALKKACTNLGVDFNYQTRMSGWTANELGVKVDTQDRIFYAKNLVLAVGAWLESSVKKLKVKVQSTAVPVYFWNIEAGAESVFEAEKRCPNMIISDVWKNEELFMIPDADFKGKVKFGIHAGEAFDIDKARPTYLVNKNRDMSRTHMQKHLKFVDNRMPSIEASCLYADTEDKSFVIDKHPQHKNVILVSGFSGTGFKFGPSVGEIVSDLIYNRIPKQNIADFSVHRDIDYSKSKL